MNKKNGGFAFKMTIFIVIVLLYPPLSDLWKIRNTYHNHKIFRDMISGKYSTKFKKSLIQNEINSTVILLEKTFQGSFKNISLEELRTRYKEREDQYYMMRGFLYFVGSVYNASIHQDFRSAYKSFERAKEITTSSMIREESDIQINTMVMFGIGTDANPAKAFRNSLHYKTDSTELQQYNQYLLGYAYLFGKGTEQNTTKAYEHLKNAGKRAYPLLAQMYASGIGVPKDMKKALELIKGAGNSDLATAILYLSDNQYTKGKYFLKKCMPKNQKCQKLYRAIYKYDFYDKILNMISYI